MTTRPVIDGRLIRLSPYDELQVVTAEIPLIVVLNVGSVHIFGEFLVPNQVQILLPFTRFSLVALLPSELQIVGMPLFCGYTRENVQRNMQLVNLSIILNSLRRSAFVVDDDPKTIGPNVLVIGELGRSSACQTLYNLALRSGWHPVKFDFDTSSGVSSGQLDKILKGPGIINAALTECNNPNIQAILNNSNTVRANDRLEALTRMCFQTSGPDQPIKLPEVLLKRDTDRPGRNRKRHHGDSSRYKQNQILFGIAKKAAAAVTAEEKENKDSGSGEEAQISNQSERDDHHAFDQLQRLSILPTSLSHWERFLKPLISMGEGKDELQPEFQHHKFLGVWTGIGDKIDSSEQFELFLSAAKNLVMSLDQSVSGSNDTKFIKASGSIADCSAEIISIDKILELGKTINATHYVAINRGDISDLLKEKGMTVFDLDTVKLTWQSSLSDAVQTMLRGSEDYYLCPPKHIIAPIPVFSPPTKLERRGAGGTNVLEALNLNESSIQPFIQAAVTSQLLPRGVNHPLAARLLHTPTNVIRHTPQTIQEKYFGDYLMIFALSIDGNKQASLTRVTFNDFLSNLQTVPRLHGALIHSPEIVKTLLKDVSCQTVSPSNFYFTFPLHIASPVVVQKMVNEPGFQLWSRACKLSDQIGFQALLILVDK